MAKRVTVAGLAVQVDHLAVLIGVINDRLDVHGRRLDSHFANIDLMAHERRAIQDTLTDHAVTLDNVRTDLTFMGRLRWLLLGQ